MSHPSNMSHQSNQIRQTLTSLQSFTLPSHYTSTPSTSVDETLLNQYRQSRDKFLLQRIEELYFEYVGTFDGSSSFQFPPPPPPPETKRDDVLHTIQNTSSELSEKFQELRSKYQIFCQKRNELETIVEEMEEQQEVMDVMESDEEGGESSVDEEEMEEQEKELEELVKKRVEMEERLRRLQMETSEIEKERSDLKRTLEDKEVEVEDMSESRYREIMEELKGETMEYKERIRECEEMEQWYDGVIEGLETVGETKILSIESDSENDGLVLKISLMEDYVLQITLSPPPSIPRRYSRGSSQDGEVLIVFDAKIIGDTLVSATCGAVNIHIPPLDDLVQLSRNLEDVENIRFIVRETTARIRGARARVEELSKLRNKYLTKIDRDGDEILCSFDDGITVVMRLTPDCPMVPGSAYIDQIAGIGGWDRELLKEMKERINSGKFVGPLEVMDALAKEIREMDEEKKPGTPDLSFWKRQ